MRALDSEESPTPVTNLFEGGPPLRLEAWLRMRKPGRRSVLRGALIATTAAWLPLALWAAWRGVSGEAEGAHAFLVDVGVHVRYLVALPALMLAEALCIPRLGEIARHFADSGLLAEADQRPFAAAVASTERLRDWGPAEIAVVLVAYSISGLLLLMPPNIEPEWYAAGGLGLAGRSLAAWWHTLVSLPLLLVITLGWLWRVMLWARFLWRMSRLDLRLLSSHPDRAGGLGFAGHSLRAFATPALGLSAIAAGGAANAILHHDASLFTTGYAVLGVILGELLLFALPLLAFSSKLLARWNRGVLEYGTLAMRVGHEFERGWLGSERRARDDIDGARPLDSPEFSATADLYQVVSNAYEMRFVPLDATSLLLLVSAAIGPFLPVLLLALPLGELLRRLAGFLL